MDNLSWQGQVTQRIEQAKRGLDKGESQRLQLPMLDRIAHRLTQFHAAGCTECGKLERVMDHLVGQAELRAQGSAVDYKEYKGRLLVLTKHLKTVHGLIEPGTNVSLGISLGLLAGVTLQSLFGTAYLGIGLCLGVAVGSMMDAKAKKDDKEI